MPVVQEACVARQIVVTCGAIEQPFDLFTNALAILTQSGMALELRIMRHDQLLSAGNGMRAMLKIWETRNRWRNEKGTTSEISLIGRVLQFGHTLTTDPRDKNLRSCRFDEFRASSRSTEAELLLKQRFQRSLLSHGSLLSSSA